MNELFIRYLCLSIFGLLLALFLFTLKPLLKNRVSKAWQYYVWIIVIIRLLIPYAPRIEITDTLFQQVGDAVAIHEETSSIQYYPAINHDESKIKQITQVTENTIQAKTDIPNYWNTIRDYAWMLWIGVAFVLFTYKILVYNSYIRYLKVNRDIVTDSEVLRIYRTVCSEVGNKATINIYTSNKVASPMLVGTIRPFIVLPSTDIFELELRNIFTHELIHFKRVDIFYKWIVQITVCLHWFNPIVYIISNEINKSCELSCDEAVIKNMDTDGKRKYGNTLLALVKVNANPIGTGISVSLNEDAKLLKERLSSIMLYKSKTKFTTVFTILLTLSLLLCSMLMGASVMAAAPSTIQPKESPLQTMIKPLEVEKETITATQAKIHPNNNQFNAIDCNKITSIKLNIDTASVNLKTTDADKFRLCYTGGTNKSYKASADVTGKNKDIVTINIKGEPQKITSIDNFTELDSVTLEIPDKAYSNISIEDNKGNLSICEMNAPITVSDKSGIINLKHYELKRGSYSLKTNNGIISVELDKLLTQLQTENTNGIVKISFIEEPPSDNFHLNIIGGIQNSVTLPKGWNKFITKNAGDLKESPCLTINNHSGFTDVIVQNSSREQDRSREQAGIMKTASVVNEKYYLIETEEDLRAIGSGSYSLSDNYMLNRDITLKKEWRAIGDDKQPFTGKFDGNGYTINNLTITDKKAKFIGLFGWVEGATINNVTLANVDIASAGGKGRSIGPIVAVAIDSDVYDNFVSFHK